MYIHHPHLSPVQKEALLLTFEMDVEMHTLADIIISGWPDDIKEVPHPLHPYWHHCESLTVNDGLVLCGEALIIPPSEKEKVLVTLHQPHQGITKIQLLAHGCVFWPGISKAIEEAFQQCEACMRFQALNTTHINTYTFMSLADLSIRHLHTRWYGLPHPRSIQGHPGNNLPAGQSNSAKVIHIWEEWFCDHGTPEVLHSDNGPQYASAAFVDGSTEWGFTHETSCPHYPQFNRFAESCVKIVKHTLQHAKYSSTNPRIALQHLKAILFDAILPSPSHMLYNYKIHTTIPSRICNTDPTALQVQEHLKD